MEDLDLDELDQQVTKMMDKPKVRRAVKTTVPPRVNLAVSQDDATPVSPAPISAPVADTSPTPAPRDAEPTRLTVNRPMPRVPERKRMHPGAMDIIQPTSPKTTAPSSRASRMASSVQPTKEVVPEPIVPVEPPKAEPALQPEAAKPLDAPQEVTDEVLASLSMADEPKVPASPVKPKPLDTQKAASDGWPDPLDFHDFSDTTPAKTPEPAVPAEEPKETPPTMDAEPVSVTDQHPDAATGNSPFVTTKVEKRPLGAYANAAPAETPTPDPLLELTDPPVPHESTTKSEMAEASLESKQHLADEPEGDLRQMAIPQQYHTAPHPAKDDVHNVFDTKEYHAAPPHMYAPRKSGPGLVIGVVVLIVLIIAAVLVGYFMVTGTFDITKLW